MKVNNNSLMLTGNTTDLGIWLNGKMVLYLEDLANPKIYNEYIQVTGNS